MDNISKSRGLMPERGQTDCDIGFFENGYTTDEISCVDLPIAACAAFHHPDFYYFYCFRLVFFLTWVKKEPAKNFLDFRNELLAPMGLCLKGIQIGSEREFSLVIRQSLEKKEPVLLFMHRQTLVYDQGYGDVDFDSLHSIIVSGYNKKYPTMCIRDISHIEMSGASYQGRGYGLFRLWLKESLLWEMWSESNKLNAALNIEPDIVRLDCVSEPIVHSFSDLIMSVHGFFMNQASAFVRLIKDESFDVSILNNTGMAASYRCRYILPMKVISDVILKAAEENEMNIYEVDLWLTHYMNRQTQIMNKLCVLAKKGLPLQNEVRKNMVEILQDLDFKLFEIMEQIISPVCW